MGGIYCKHRDYEKYKMSVGKTSRLDCTWEALTQIRMRLKGVELTGYV
jgi:hypothetical protein